MFFFGGIGVCQACICVVPGLIMWYGMRLCFEIFFGECGCVDSSVQWVFTLAVWLYTCCVCSLGCSQCSLPVSGEVC